MTNPFFVAGSRLLLYLILKDLHVSLESSLLFLKLGLKFLIVDSIEIKETLLYLYSNQIKRRVALNCYLNRRILEIIYLQRKSSVVDLCLSLDRISKRSL